MLSEVIVEVLRFLIRDTLDNVEIAARGFNSLVTTHFDVYPLRNIRRFTVYVDGAMAFETMSQVLDLTDFPDLGRALRRMFVRATHFYCVLTHNIIDTLLPHAQSFTNAVCHAPYRYASSDVITRAFTELFFCREICAASLSVQGVDSYWAYNNITPFVSLPCISHCDLLHVQDVFKTKNEFTAKLMAWLHSGGEKKKLTLQCDVTHMSLHWRSGRLFENLETATAPSEYEFCLIYAGNIPLDNKKKVNALTKEQLTLTYERDGSINKAIFTRCLL